MMKEAVLMPRIEAAALRGKSVIIISPHQVAICRKIIKLCPKSSIRSYADRSVNFSSGGSIKVLPGTVAALQGRRFDEYYIRASDFSINKYGRLMRVIGDCLLANKTTEQEKLNGTA